MKTTNDWRAVDQWDINSTTLITETQGTSQKGGGKIRRPDGHENGCKTASYGYDRDVELMTCHINSCGCLHKVTPVSNPAWMGGPTLFQEL